MRIFYTLSIICCLVFGADAQTKRAFTKAGDKAFKIKNYSSALSHYATALEFDNDNTALLYKYAEAARMYQASDIAQVYYQKVVNSSNADRFPLTQFWLAMVEKQMGKYDLAMTSFQAYLDGAGKNNQLFAEKAKKEIEACSWAKEQVDQPHNITIEQLSKRINSPYSEFGPLLKGDTLYFSSYRFENYKDSHEPRRRLSKVLSSVKGSKGKPLARGFNAKEKLTAHNTFSKDGKRIYYTICEYTGEVSIRCQLYYREQGSRKRWGKAKRLPKEINMSGYTATQPHLGQHPQTGKTVLYFVSDRPGGKGQLDIWYSELDAQGKTGKAVNLEAINTAENEITPFYRSVSKTLYFSSDGYRGMGGYDIYTSAWQEGQWQMPEHGGAPLNSSYNDVYYVLNADSTSAYFSSNRLGAFYLEKENKVCCNDIYKVDIPPPLPEEEPEPEPVEIVEMPPVVIEPEPMPVVEPEIPVVKVEPITPEIVPEVVVVPEAPKVTPEVVVEQPPVPTRLVEFLPLPLYFDNDEPDKDTRRQTTEKNYEQSYFAYYDLKATFLKEYLSPLAGNDRSIGQNEVELFFEQKVKKGYEQLQMFTALLLDRLQSGENIEIFIKGFTSPRAQNDYNVFLGKRRVSSVVNYFKNYQEQILNPYLISGQLKLSEQSFGETTASPNISDALNDPRNSIYHPAASQERRVEIVEIKQN